ncbi:RNA-directed DNA polymerase [Neisseria sp. CCUG12390]|uniref:RNA-directed DNA polymerase n=1 Tax=Neisseria sp. CCUG12390 TaxID=3392035 RepID=UPI003A0FFF9B
MNRKSVLDLTHHEARKFFLKHESYCSLNLPKYFSFTDLLEKISSKYAEKDFSSISDVRKMVELNDVNYLIYANKDGKLSWRPFQIIHPLAYVALVYRITSEEDWEKLQNRFREFQSDEKIKCLSIPVQSENKKSDKAQQISNWWEQVEQQSILLSLEYDYIYDTDIADCYGSIYTHSIAWAVESKEVAKSKKGRNDIKILGNFIDKNIQNTQCGQTNGIPQGSVLMDFVAEILLGYLDKILSDTLKRYNITEYQILRYRDDYRIFVKNPNDGEEVLKLLSEIMMPFGLKLNASKTTGSQDVITQSIKKDKLAWLTIPGNDEISLQKQLLLIRQHSINYPNSGSLDVALNRFNEKIEKQGETHSTEQLISIVTNIAYNNPRTIPICCAIVSKLLSQIDNADKMAKLVYTRLSKMPNSGFAQIWLQRMLKADLDGYEFSEKMCNLGKLKTSGNCLWNNDWINSGEIKKILNDTAVFYQDIFDELDRVILNEEVDIFTY